MQAGDLFQQDSNGLENLSPNGQARIDGAIVQLSGSLEAASLIVEGYSATQSPAEQLAASRNRAILVRDYIRRRFHLYAQDVVIESMGNRPPARLDKDRWDGVSIVLLHADSR
jgi:outer membrane protein OmpA-like peptidoglycan-associated protein